MKQNTSASARFELLTKRAHKHDFFDEMILVEPRCEVLDSQMKNLSEDSRKNITRLGVDLTNDVLQVCELAP
jgi:hypothetical protein